MMVNLMQSINLGQSDGSLFQSNLMPMIFLVLVIPCGIVPFMMGILARTLSVSMLGSPSITVIVPEAASSLFVSTMFSVRI